MTTTAFLTIYLAGLVVTYATFNTAITAPSRDQRVRKVLEQIAFLLSLLWPLTLVGLAARGLYEMFGGLEEEKKILLEAPVPPPDDIVPAAPQTKEPAPLVGAYALVWPLPAATINPQITVGSAGNERDVPIDQVHILLDTLCRNVYAVPVGTEDELRNIRIVGGVRVDISV